MRERDARVLRRLHQRVAGLQQHPALGRVEREAEPVVREAALGGGPVAQPLLGLRAPARGRSGRRRSRRPAPAARRQRGPPSRAAAGRSAARPETISHTEPSASRPAPRSPCAIRMPASGKSAKAARISTIAHELARRGPSRGRARGRARARRARSASQGAPSKAESASLGRHARKPRPAPRRAAAGRPTTRTRRRSTARGLVVDSSIRLGARRPSAARAAFAFGLPVETPSTPLSSGIVASGTHLREPGRITGLSPSTAPARARSAGRPGPSARSRCRRPA